MHENKITIHINMDSLAIRILLLASLLSLLGGSVALASQPASTSKSSLQSSSTLRNYYLTINTFQGADVLTACDSNYHMASLWEILDPSNLSYNTTLGFYHTPGDSAPPTNTWGWVRTGNVPSIGTPGGNGNCASWSSSSSDYSGTIISLPNNWTTPGSTMGVWINGDDACDQAIRVWCVNN
jgi:hypothetical protein